MSDSSIYRDNLVKLARNLGTRHSEDCAIQEDVFAASQLGVKASADFEQAGNATTEANASFRRFCDAAQNFQQSRFARAIPANDAENVALLDFKGDVL